MATKKLGDKITFDKILEKHWGESKDGEKGKTKWRITSADKKEGVVVGVRTLREGFTDSQNHPVEDYSVNVGFTVTKSFKAYLVSFSMHRNPIFVPIESE